MKLLPLLLLLTPLCAKDLPQARIDLVAPIFTGLTEVELVIMATEHLEDFWNQVYD